MSHASLIEVQRRACPKCKLRCGLVAPEDYILWYSPQLASSLDSHFRVTVFTHDDSIFHVSAVSQCSCPISPPQCPSSFRLQGNCPATSLNESEIVMKLGIIWIFLAEMVAITFLEISTSQENPETPQPFWKRQFSGDTSGTHSKVVTAWPWCHPGLRKGSDELLEEMAPGRGLDGQSVSWRKKCRPTGGPGSARQPFLSLTMPSPLFPTPGTFSVCVTSISTGSSTWTRETRHSGPPHPLTGVVHGPEAWSRCSVPLSTSQGPACSTLHAQRLSQNGQSTFLPMVPHCLHPSLTKEDGFIPAQDKDIDLVCKRTFISKLRPQKQKLPLLDLCHSHQTIPQTPQ